MSVSESGSVLKNYTYDIGGNRTSYTLKVGGVTTVNTSYTYDELSRLSTVSENNALTATYTYDINGNRASLTYANGTTTAYTYNLANLITSLVNAKVSSVLSSYDYTYYLDGNQATKESHDGKLTTYTYDGVGRLTSEVESDTSGLIQGMGYTYDLSHNRYVLTATGEQAFTTGYVYDLDNRLVKEVKADSESIHTTEYTYDYNGNQVVKYYWVLTYPTSTQASVSIDIGGQGLDFFSYDGLNRLTLVEVGGVNAKYTYKTDGLRISKTVDGNTTRHIWDGANISVEVGGDGSVTTIYIRGINLIASDDSSNNRRYYLYNAHGDTVQLTGSTLGAVIRDYSYDGFGVEKNPSSGDTNPFRYCGEYWDQEAGTYYLRARYYDPVVGRFTQEDTHWNPSNMVYGDDPVKWNEQEADPRDPLGLATYTYMPDMAAIRQSGNLYVYCGSNPVMYHDSSGQFWDIILDIGGIIWSTYDLITSPSLANAGFLLLDIGSAFVPFVPAAGRIAKGASKIDDIIDATKGGAKIASDIASSKALREAMEQAGKTAGKSDAAHHIVAGSAKGAEKAREILKKFGIGINDAANGVFLSTIQGTSGAYHPGLHTAKYYDAVNQMLGKAKNKDEAIKILNEIANQLRMGIFPK